MAIVLLYTSATTLQKAQLSYAKQTDWEKRSVGVKTDERRSTCFVLPDRLDLFPAILH